jgi:ubiquinone/menaquinone biosynthesis C-methylase UbiE
MFSTPELCLSQFNVEPGMVVADLGCGIGAYTFELAHRVTSTGKVIAVDVQKNLVDTLANECKQRSLHHVTVLWDDMDDSNGIALNDASIDRIVIANILFQLDDIQKFATEVKRILKSNGQVLIIEWSDSFGGLGPTLQHVVTPERTQEIFEKVGLYIHKKITAGDHHYGFVLQSK